MKDRTCQWTTAQDRPMARGPRDGQPRDPQMPPSHPDHQSADLRADMHDDALAADDAAPQRPPVPKPVHPVDPPEVSNGDLTIKLATWAETPGWTKDGDDQVLVQKKKRLWRMIKE